MKKYLLAGIFFLALFFPHSLFAVDLNNMFNGTSVSTDFGTWDSPRTGNKYFYGGSYRFAFEGAGRMQPLFQGEPPSMKVGCNGFSLRGGFLALLGISEIKQLLSSSGATLAWGIMMGLEYSMPGLAKVFNTLRQYAREIQQLLGNMCNLGQMLGRSSGINAQMNSLTNNLTGDLNGVFENLNNGLIGMGENIKKGFDLSPTKDCSHKTGSAQEQCLNQVGMTSSTAAAKISNTNSLSLTSMAIGATSKKLDKPTNTIYISKLSSFLDDGKIGSRSIVSNSTELDNIKATVLLGRLFFGDMATPVSTLEYVMKLTNDASNGDSSIKTGSFPLDPDKAIKQLTAKVSEQVQEEKFEGMSRIQPVINSAEQVAKALIDGITAETQIDYCSAGACQVPDSFIYLMDVALKADANTSTDAAQVIGNVWDSSKSSNLEIKWEGGYLESLKLIRYKVQQLSGFAPTIMSTSETSVSIKSSGATDIKIPLLLPNIQKYMQNIAVLEKRAKGETPYTAQLKSILARYNAYFFATSMTDLITGRVLDALGTKGDPVGNPDYKNIKPYVDEMLEKKRKIDEKIKEDMKNQISYQELAQTFEAVGKELTKDQMKEF